MRQYDISESILQDFINHRRKCAGKGYCSPSVGRSVCPHVFSLTVAAVDTKRGYVGMCNGRSAQQESGAALSKNSMFTAGA